MILGGVNQGRTWEQTQQSLKRVQNAYGGPLKINSPLIYYEIIKYNSPFDTNPMKNIFIDNNCFVAYPNLVIIIQITFGIALIAVLLGTRLNLYAQTKKAQQKTVGK